MNVHPLIIHFPIALLSTYCVFELLRFRKLNGNVAWFSVKSILLILGTLGGLAALLTGTIAKHILDAQGNSLVSFHESVAQVTIALFGALSAGYLVAWAKRSDLAHITERNIFFKKMWALLFFLEHYLIETPFVIVLALAGIAGLTATGALGASIVYGTQGDIVTQAVARVLGVR